MLQLLYKLGIRKHITLAHKQKQSFSPSEPHASHPVSLWLLSVPAEKVDWDYAPYNHRDCWIGDLEDKSKLWLQKSRRDPHTIGSL
jgi:hypothetical protein